MKKIIFIAISIATITIINCCNQPSDNPTSSHQEQIDKLKNEMTLMEPELGEIMLGIQTHHAKLYFAGINTNWELANFEIEEIYESLEKAQRFGNDRPEISSLSMLFPALDSLAKDITMKNEKSFESNFQILTTTCNSCHITNKKGFNVITIPSAPPVNNQEFKVQETK